MAASRHYIVIPPCPDVLSGTAVEGSKHYTEINVRLPLPNHRLDHVIYRIAAARSHHRGTRFWHLDYADLWVTGRLAGGIYQHMAAGAAMASFSIVS